jgi:hypothetical protein
MRAVLEALALGSVCSGWPAFALEVASIPATTVIMTPALMAINAIATAISPTSTQIIRLGAGE